MMRSKVTPYRATRVTMMFAQVEPLSYVRFLGKLSPNKIKDSKRNKWFVGVRFPFVPLTKTCRDYESNNKFYRDFVSLPKNGQDEHGTSIAST